MCVPITCTDDLGCPEDFECIAGATTTTSPTKWNGGGGWKWRDRFLEEVVNAVAKKEIIALNDFAAGNSRQEERLLSHCEDSGDCTNGLVCRLDDGRECNEDFCDDNEDLCFECRCVPATTPSVSSTILLLFSFDFIRCLILNLDPQPSSPRLLQPLSPLHLPCLHRPLLRVARESLTFATPLTCLALFVAQIQRTQSFATIAPLNVKLRDIRWMSAALTGSQ